MAKMRTKDKKALLIFGLVIGIPIFVIQQISEAGAWPLVIGALVVAIAWYLFAEARKHSKRLAYLRKRYSDESTVQAILKGAIWDGMSQEQLSDSNGRPSSIDQKYLKTKTREV